MTMTQTFCTMPTAVMTESREKTRSMIAIWAMALPKVRPTAARAVAGCSSVPSTLW